MLRAKAVNSLGRAILSKESAAKVYEVFLMVALAEQLTHRGFVWEIRDFTGRKCSTLYYRGSPAFLSSGGSLAIWRPKKPSQVFEFFNGVRWIGHSGESHEADIALINSRNLKGYRKANHAVFAPIIFAAECKYIRTTLPLDYVRSLLGLHLELNPSHMHLVTKPHYNRSIYHIARHYRRFRWPIYYSWKVDDFTDANLKRFLDFACHRIERLTSD